MTDSVVYSKILVPTDGSSYALLAGRHAAYLAKITGASVVVLNVMETDMAFHAGIHYAEEVAQMEKAGLKATAGIRELCTAAGVESKELVVKGSPVATILKVADEERVDLIVMGTVGMSAVERVLLGSVSGKVSHHARCPVLLVRER
ncbi:MAG: Universal stress protein [Methanocella sp. PtaU1.Bin125]|nr:MAG: Universal stress protein [Methanocella sp. PtaU1.Bin125]